MISRFLKYGAVLLICIAALWIAQSGIARSAIVGAGATARPLSGMIQCPFIPDGYFYLKGSAPEGFEDFDHITLVSANGDHPPADSRLDTSNGKSYKFTELAKFITHSSGSGIVFEFETELIEGVSYKFKGKFIRICRFAEEETDPQRVVAEGRITKFKRGKEAATAEVQFTYSKAQRREANP